MALLFQLCVDRFRVVCARSSLVCRTRGEVGLRFCLRIRPVDMRTTCREAFSAANEKKARLLMRVVGMLLLDSCFLVYFDF